MGLNIDFIDYSVDPFDSDSPSPARYRTSKYSGSDPQFTIPSSPNFPDSRAGTPSRYFVYFPGIIDVSDLGGSYPATLYDEDSSVTMTRVTAAPNTNEYRIVTNTDSQLRTAIEFNSAQAGNTVSYDLYTLGSIVTANEFDNINNTSVTTDDLTVNNQGTIIVEDQKATTTNGGTFTSGAWRKRDLNTEVYDDNSHCKLTSALAYAGQTGNFTIGEVVTGATSSATGTIVFDEDAGATGTLYLIDVLGSFGASESISDPIAGAATSNGTQTDGNQMWLNSGTYAAYIKCPALQVSSHQARLYDQTGSATLCTGSNEVSGAGDTTATSSVINGSFTLSVNSVVEIQHYASATKANNGFGAANAFGLNEVYTTGKLNKLL